MTKRSSISHHTRVNWLVDAQVFLVGLGAGVSALYFLLVPSGGYQGGRNPLYGIQVVFTRAVWVDLHTWAGVLTILAALVHFFYHWSWVKMMARRFWSALWSKGKYMSHGARVNVGVNLILALGFILAAISGVYLLFAPTGGYQSGANVGWDPGFLFARTTWDLMHTWSGVLTILGAGLHFIIHWGWITKVTRLFFHIPIGQRAAKAGRLLVQKN